MSRFWISTCTRRTPPLPVAVPGHGEGRARGDHTALDRRDDRGLVGRRRRHRVEVEERDATRADPAHEHRVTTGEQTARGGLHGLVALEGVRDGSPVQRRTRGRVERTEVLAVDDVVAEAVAREPLALAVADVVESRPRLLGGRGLVPVEVATDVDRLLGDGHRVDAVEAAGDPERLDEVASGDRVGDSGVADGRCVTTGAAGHDEVLVVRRDVHGVDAGHTTDAGEVVVPEPRAPREQLLAGRVDDGHGEPVLAGDLATGVQHEELGVVVGELEAAARSGRR